MNNNLDDSKASKFYVPLATANYGSVNNGENIMLGHYYDMLLEIEKEKNIEDQYSLVNRILASVEHQPNNSSFMCETVGPRGGFAKIKITKESLLKLTQEIKSSIDEKYAQYMAMQNKKDEMIKQLLNIETILDSSNTLSISDLEDIKTTLRTFYHVSLFTFNYHEKFNINGKNFTLNKFRDYINDLDDLANEKIQSLAGTNTPQ